MKVVIVGAGPAGLFAAYKLAGKADVTVIDEGRDIDSRKCPSPKKCRETCRPCNILCGIGGAGLFSDGKIILSNKIGNNLTPIVGEAKNNNLVRQVKKIFEEYGIKIENLTEEGKEKVEELKKKARIIGADFLYAPQTHIGTDKLRDLIHNFKKGLSEKGVKFMDRTDVLKINDKILTNKGSFDYDKAILAPGRVGASWLEGVVQDLGLSYSYHPIDVGVRVEVPREITDDITNVVRDMKFYLKSNTYSDLLRTFCTCPGGKVTRETHKGFNLVNGHSESNHEGPNTNFAFLVTMPLTTPQSNTNSYGHGVANLAYVTGVKQPLLQRLGDIRKGHRSHVEKKGEFLVKPTLEDVIYGDIGLAIPYRIEIDILEGLEKLDKIIPGVANDETLLYAPEIKFHGLRPHTNRYLAATKKKNVYFAGDGAALSRGIAGAACSGILAAEGIIKDIRK